MGLGSSIGSVLGGVAGSIIPGGTAIGAGLGGADATRDKEPWVNPQGSHWIKYVVNPYNVGAVQNQGAKMNIQGDLGNVRLSVTSGGVWIVDTSLVFAEAYSSPMTGWITIELHIKSLGILDLYINGSETPDNENFCFANPTGNLLRIRQDGSGYLNYVNQLSVTKLRYKG